MGADMEAKHRDIFLNHQHHRVLLLMYLCTGNYKDSLYARPLHPEEEGTATAQGTLITSC